MSNRLMFLFFFRINIQIGCIFSSVYLQFANFTLNCLHKSSIIYAEGIHKRKKNRKKELEGGEVLIMYKLGVFREVQFLCTCNHRVHSSVHKLIN